MSPEYQVARTYLEWLADLPWSKSTEDYLDIPRAEQVLHEDHYGLEKVKQRILDFLAVLKLKAGATRGPILCFVGPPGTARPPWASPSPPRRAASSSAWPPAA